MKRYFLWVLSSVVVGLSVSNFGAGVLGSAVAGTSMSPQPQTAKSVATVVQMSYYAQPGKEQEVLQNRLQASQVLQKNGVPRGRVMARIHSPRTTSNADDPDVVWEGEFPDAAALERYEQIADSNPDFRAARNRTGTLTRKTERRYFEVR